MAGTHVKGLRETLAALRKIDKQLPKLVTDELKQAAEPVAAAAQQRIGLYRGASVATIKPRVTGRAVVVRQNARKRGGKRGDFGALQQRHLEAALDENEAKVTREVERALDRIIGNAGF